MPVTEGHKEGKWRREREADIEKARTRVTTAEVDVGLLLKRAANLARGLLDQLEDAATEAAINRNGVPRGYTNDYSALCTALDKLTIAQARFAKTEAEWAEGLSLEGKLDAMTKYLVALNHERPEVVLEWWNKTRQALNTQRTTLPEVQAKRDAWHGLIEVPEHVNFSEGSAVDHDDIPPGPPDEEL